MVIISITIFYFCTFQLKKTKNSDETKPHKKRRLDFYFLFFTFG